MESLWGGVLNEIEKKVSKQCFNTWFKPIKFISFELDTLRVGVPNQFFKGWLDCKYKDFINDILSTINKRPSVVEFVIQPNKDENHPVSTEKKKEKKRLNEGSFFNPKYTFESFVVGESNRFAHAACLAVADSPASAYNPLFIYGGVGLGKTHLMHAIGHFIKKNNPFLKAFYVSTEQFTNDFIDSIRYERSLSFKNKYRSIDVLLVDDIQFLAGKEQTQDEFFYTFNTLYESGRQIVLSSDRPPKEIPTLEDRLRSRFECGLITDIHAPDFETRVAILKKKADEEKIDVPNNVIYFIADKIKYNIRELEGALIRIAAFSSFEKKKIDLPTIKETLKDILPEDELVFISIDLIQKKTAKYFKISLNDMKSRKKSSMVALPRQVAMYLCRQLTDYSLPEIGREFGGRDHTTVLHACEKIKKAASKDIKIKEAIEKITQDIKKFV
jgi:chromosomal replication initiator protein